MHHPMDFNKAISPTNRYCNTESLQRCRIPRQFVRIAIGKCWQITQHTERNLHWCHEIGSRKINQKIPYCLDKQMSMGILCVFALAFYHRSGVELLLVDYCAIVKQLFAMLPEAIGLAIAIKVNDVILHTYKEKRSLMSYCLHTKRSLMSYSIHT